jgi:hypothetical protein
LLFGCTGQPVCGDGVCHPLEQDPSSPFYCSADCYEIACPEVWDPVCGVDGITYSNNCYAYVADVKVDFVGECVDEITECISIWDPVCGVDGVTYSNDCYAYVAGVKVDYEGQCVGMISRCTSNWDPVCGVDGVTYTNQCYASLVLVDVDYYGECVEDVNLASCNNHCDCELNQFCDSGKCRDIVEGEYCGSQDDFCAKLSHNAFLTCADNMQVIVQGAVDCPPANVGTVCARTNS